MVVDVLVLDASGRNRRGREVCRRLLLHRRAQRPVAGKLWELGHVTNPVCRQSLNI